MAAAHGDLRHLLPGNYKRQIADWLEEDCPSLDYGGFVVGESEGEARLLGKSAVSDVLICLILCFWRGAVCVRAMVSIFSSLEFYETRVSLLIYTIGCTCRRAVLR